ncbi:MAG TPA: cyclic nucleotide-binding domain-containing protein [Candidatus Margulisiibacteriota bacterium]|nr:cyclic nucleotide-binding domain-containing protein [Candidatus Margulisiibacteriota bacterium]
MALFQFSEDHKSFSAGEEIFAEGQPGDVMYVVKEGEVDLMVHGKLVDTVGPGGVLGEMALIDHRPRSAAAVARTDCRLVPINETRFQFLVQQTPFFSLEVMRILVHRLRKMDETLPLT